MELMDFITWTFRVAFIVGGLTAGIAAVRYLHRSGGAGNLRPAGRAVLILCSALAVAFLAVAARVLARLPWVLQYAPWADQVVLWVAAVAVWSAVAGTAYFWWTVENYQPDYSGNHHQEREDA